MLLIWEKCNCSSLTSLNLSNFNTNNVKDMWGMFCNCSSLIFLNSSNFYTNNIKDMRDMLYGVNRKKCKLICNDAQILREFSKK